MEGGVWKVTRADVTGKDGMLLLRRPSRDVRPPGAAAAAAQLILSCVASRGTARQSVTCSGHTFTSAPPPHVTPAQVLIPIHLAAPACVSLRLFTFTFTDNFSINPSHSVIIVADGVIRKGNFAWRGCSKKVRLITLWRAAEARGGRTEHPLHLKSRRCYYPTTSVLENSSVILVVAACRAEWWCELASSRVAWGSMPCEAAREMRTRHEWSASRRGATHTHGSPHARPARTGQPPLPAWRPPKVTHTHIASWCYISQAIIEAANPEKRKWMNADSRWR